MPAEINQTIDYRKPEMSLENKRSGLINLYEIKRSCAMWQVVLRDSKKVVFQSCVKANCVDWLNENFGVND